MRAILKYLDDYVSGIKYKRTSNTVNVLRVLLLDMCLPSRRNKNTCVKNNYNS